MYSKATPQHIDLREGKSYLGKKKLRRLIEIQCPADFKMIESNYSGIEIRMMAWLRK